MIIYHANCTDGWTAAWAYLQGSPGKKEVAIPMSYGDDLPIISKDECVVFLDFWPGAGRLKELAKRVPHVLVLDHHATALTEWEKHKDEFAELPVDVTFDMNKSGALMAWEFWQSDPPDLVKYVSDNDLWKHELPDSRMVSAYIQSWDHTHENWDWLGNLTAEELREAAKESWRIKQQICSIAVKNAYMMDLHCNHKTYRAAVINVSFPTTQDVLSKLADEHGMALGYCRMRDGKWKISVRTREGAPITAKSYCESKGGGGHEHAAGYVTDSTPIYLM
ncbi:MAG: hypothetical protein E6R03_08940 [Hyphomicrobiaceae bacterium]|nr:MAG: hypothetical protein E6R03_08940 [Hyphomicrobiaceae bacterium]